MVTRHEYVTDYFLQQNIVANCTFNVILSVPFCPSSACAGCAVLVGGFVDRLMWHIDTFHGFPIVTALTKYSLLTNISKIMSYLPN